MQANFKLQTIFKVTKAIMLWIAALWQWHMVYGIPAQRSEGLCHPNGGRSFGGGGDIHLKYLF